MPIDLTNSTGLRTKTLTAASPPCRASGFTAAKCFCDRCDNLAATPCMSNADCIAVGAAICGGKRCLGGVNAGAPCSSTSQCSIGGGICGVPGAATAYNQCSDAVCSPTNTCVGGSNQNTNCTANSEGPGGLCVAGNEGECQAGPFEQFCGPNATFQSCTADDLPGLGRLELPGHWVGHP